MCSFCVKLLSYIKALRTRYDLSLSSLCLIFVAIVVVALNIGKHNQFKNKAVADQNTTVIPTINPNVTPCLGDEQRYVPQSTLARRDIEKPVDSETAQRMNLTFGLISGMPKEIDSGEFSYSDKLHAIAYITGDRWGSEEDKTALRSVYIYFLDTKENRKIIDIRNRGQKDKYEYVFGLTDAGFSDDGKYLAIFTSEDLYLYDMQTQALTHEFHEGYPLKAGVGGVFSYSHPRFTSDDNKILITVGYYEGSSQAVYDTTTRNLTKLPYSMYGYGDEALEWYKDKLIVLRINSDETTKKEYEHLLLVDFPSLSETLIKTFNNGEIGRVYYDKQKTLYITGDETFPSGTFQCQNGNRSEYVTKISHFKKMDLDTNDITTLIEYDNTNTTGFVYHDIQDIKMLDGRLLLKLENDWQGNFTIEELDPNLPNALINLNI